jgi:HD superfamily phosphodiesterase
MEDIAAEEWHEQLLFTVARVKAFFGYSKDKQDNLITFAEALSGAHMEETSENREEAELDEAWDLDAAQKMLQQNAW